MDDHEVGQAGVGGHGYEIERVIGEEEEDRDGDEHGAPVFAWKVP